MPSGRQVPSVFAKPESLRSNPLAGAPPLKGLADGGLSNILEQAASVLARELGGDPTSLVGRSLPVMPGAPSPGSAPGGLPRGFDPFSKQTQSMEGLEFDHLRRQVHEVVETFLNGLIPKAPVADRVPLLHAEAAVDPGGLATAYIRVANEDVEASEVSLYCTNFVADSGHEIPALHARFSPRVARIPPKGEVTFEMKVAVPLQASAEVFSALVQAMGAKYVKAVVSVEVR
jgi:hypothetical protein